MTRSHHLAQRILLALAFGSVAVLSGCGAGSSSSLSPTPLDNAKFEGRVHGGQQPVAGATIQLYKANTTSFFGNSTPLIPTTVLTNADGSFSITGLYPAYTCQPGDYLYITGTGGNPGVSGTSNNSALTLMAGLGPCSNVTSSTFISINELTTVATAWALGGFMRSPTVVATTPTNVAGLGMAFAAINKLVNLQTGALVGPTLPAGASIPVAELNTLADILATCVNTVDTTSPAAQSSSCQAIFTAEGLPAGTTSDTITAALYLAHNPAKATSLYLMAAAAGAPYQPTLVAAPTDWTVAINYVGGGLNNPAAIAADEAGNIWIANSGSNSVTKLDNTGAVVSGANGYSAGGITAPVGLAIDLNGNPWIANGNSTVTHLSADGATGTAFGLGVLNMPTAVAIDVAGEVWIANYGDSSITMLNSDGTPSFLAGISVGGISRPTAIALNPL